jgi:hypothetical protein
MRALRRDLHQTGNEFPELLEELRTYLGRPRPRQAVIGVCTVCDRSFTVPLPAIKRVVDAQESLRVQFEHKCNRQDADRGGSVLETD